MRYYDLNFVKLGLFRISENENSMKILMNHERQKTGTGKRESPSDIVLNGNYETLRAE